MSQPKPPQTGTALILAAGQAQRMGVPKQLIPIEGVPLLLRAIAAAQGAQLRPLVVLGAHRDKVEAILPEGTARLVHPGWETGMGSSISAGLHHLFQTAPPPRRLMVMVCDQPHITAKHLGRLLKACDTDLVDAAAAQYQGLLGTPACFTPRAYPQLRALPPHQGARKLLRSGRLTVAPVPMPEAGLDLDTPDDVAQCVGAETAQRLLKDAAHRPDPKHSS
ncbi:MAG: nucleotidyltransferase family protein [Myxococcota bacterium]